MNRSTTTHTTQRGFTLIEVAILIVVVSVVVGYMLSFYMTDKSNAAATVTRQRVERVLDATASFVIDNNRLPFATMTADGLEGTILRGIVPYQTLGLSREDVLDGFGNPLTFIVAAPGTTALASPVRISPVVGSESQEFFNDTYSSGSGAQDTFRTPSSCPASTTCRPGSLNQSYRSYAPVKAVDDRRSNFCYDGSETYYGFTVASYSPLTTNINHPGITVDKVDDNNVPGFLQRLTVSAFVVVISHGENGSGGYRFPAGGGNVVTFTNGVRGNAEVFNSAPVIPATITDRVVIADYNQRDVNHFDDEVSYLTGQQLVGRTGSTSCHNYYPMCDCRAICMSWRAMPQSNVNYNDMIFNLANTTCPTNQAAAASDPLAIGDRAACACCARYDDNSQPQAETCAYKPVP